MKLHFRLANRSNSGTNKQKKSMDTNQNESEVRFLQAKNKDQPSQDNSSKLDDIKTENILSCIEKSNKSSQRSRKASDTNLDVDFINKKLPKELIIRIFSYLDINSMCRCACVSKVHTINYYFAFV